MPETIAERLNEATRMAFADEKLQQQFTTSGFEPPPDRSPDVVRRWVDEEIGRFFDADQTAIAELHFARPAAFALYFEVKRLRDADCDTEFTNRIRALRRRVRRSGRLLRGTLAGGCQHLGPHIICKAAGSACSDNVINWTGH
jgi:hypothetical protein